MDCGGGGDVVVKNVHGSETDADVDDDVPLIPKAHVSQTFVIAGSETPPRPDIDDDACLVVLRDSFVASLNAAFPLDALVECSTAPKYRLRERFQC